MNHPFRLLDPSAPDVAFSGRCALTVMAKAPVPGKVKTRLSPPLTAEQAAELNACFLRDTAANLGAAGRLAPAELVISYTPVGAEAAFTGILPQGAMLLPQRGDGFGERLLTTAEDLFSCGFSAVCLIDSDSPTVPTAEFVTAARELLRAGGRAVLGPSADGGYYLIGLQRPEHNLFERITWSTSTVAAETLQRADEIGLPIILLAEWFDVDDAASLDRLRNELTLNHRAAPGFPAQHTREYLALLEEMQSEIQRIEKSA